MKKRTFWILELFVWGLILFSIIFTCGYINQKKIEENSTYYVFFKDVDGLIKGSPVKIQGYQIGYISNIELMEDQAFITFVVTDKNIEMPNKLSASIAFTGMGGSKSLELFVPPPNAKEKNYITTKEPRRINDFYMYQNQIAKLLVSMTGDFMQMFNDRNITILKTFIKNPAPIEKADEKLEEFQYQVDKYNNNHKIMEKK